MTASLVAFALSGMIAADPSGVVKGVRDAVARKDLALAERLVADDRAARGITPEGLEAESWLGRGALAAGQYDQAEAFAARTRKLVLGELKNRALDAERHLPIALGATIEVQAQVMAARGEKSQAVAMLQRELETWGKTSIRTRIQKNIHLLSLEGKPAPALELEEWVGRKPRSLAELKGKPLLLFFWAHWCGPCKQHAPILAEIQKRHPEVVVIGPTRRYGFAARGQEASPEAEKQYIAQVRERDYGALGEMDTPLSEANAVSYGVSTTPTIVLVNREGTVSLYHSGTITLEELEARVRTVLGR